jgi:hypothetical protein
MNCELKPALQICGAGFLVALLLFHLTYKAGIST